MYKFTTIDKSFIIYENDKVSIPLLLFENYIHKPLQLETISKINDLMSIGDLIETKIYTDQNWSF